MSEGLREPPDELKLARESALLCGEPLRLVGVLPESEPPGMLAGDEPGRPPAPSRRGDTQMCVCSGRCSRTTCRSSAEPMAS